MHGKSAVLILAAGTLAFPLASSPAFASTSIASFAVTAIVEAGCQASAVPSALESGAAPSVNCSLPVSYQVVVGRSSGGRTAAAGSLGGAPALAPASAQSNNLRLLGLWSAPSGVDWNEESGDRSFRPFSSLSSTGPVAAAQCVLSGAAPETITVTIIY